MGVGRGLPGGKGTPSESTYIPPIANFPSSKQEFVDDAKTREKEFYERVEKGEVDHV